MYKISTTIWSKLLTEKTTKFFRDGHQGETKRPKRQRSQNVTGSDEIPPHKLQFSLDLKQ